MRSSPRRRSGLAALLAALAGLVSVAAGAQSTSAEEFRREVQQLRDERDELEVAIQPALRQLPAEPETEFLEARIRHLAEIAGLEVDFRALEGGEVPALPDGSPGPLRLDRIELSGRGELHPIGSLLALLAAGDLRLRDLESLAVESDAGAWRFAARLLYPTWTGAGPPRTSTGGTLSSTLGELRAEVERLRERRLDLDGWSARSADGRLAAAAALVDALAGLEATAVTRIHLDGRIEVAGATVGAAARAALVRAIENADFTIAATDTPAAGACRPFASALAARGARAAFFASPAVAPAGDPRAVAQCAVELELRAGVLEARGDAARPGVFSLRARELDLADLFRLLHEATGEGFVVDPDVRGRVDVDFVGVTTDEALAAIRAHGLVLGPAPLRRVARRPGPARADEWTGAPVTLAVRRLELSRLLCLLDEPFALVSRVEPGLDATVTIFAAEVPWDLAMARALESAGLSYAIVDAVVHVGSAAHVDAVERGPWQPACEAAAAPAAPSLAGALVELDDLEPSDLALAAIVDAERGGRRAWAYGAFRSLHSLDAGTRLHGATVEAVSPTGVRLRSDVGPPADLTLAN